MGAALHILQMGCTIQISFIREINEGNLDCDKNFVKLHCAYHCVTLNLLKTVDSKDKYIYCLLDTMYDYLEVSLNEEFPRLVVGINVRYF